MIQLPASSCTVRARGFPENAGCPYYLFDDDTTLKAHPDYRLAKAGDQAAAVNVVWDLAADFLDKLVEKLPRQVIYVAPFAREATGDNAIPQVLAAACASLAGGSVDNGSFKLHAYFTLVLTRWSD